MCEIDGYMNYIVFVSMLDLSGCGSLVVDVFSVWKWQYKMFECVI